MSAGRSSSTSTPSTLRSSRTTRWGASSLTNSRLPSLRSAKNGVRERREGRIGSERALACGGQYHRSSSPVRLCFFILKHNLCQRRLRQLFGDLQRWPGAYLCIYVLLYFEVQYIYVVLCSTAVVMKIRLCDCMAFFSYPLVCCNTTVLLYAQDGIHAPPMFSLAVYSAAAVYHALSHRHTATIPSEGCRREPR